MIRLFRSTRSVSDDVARFVSNSEFEWSDFEDYPSAKEKLPEVFMYFDGKVRSDVLKERCLRLWEQIHKDQRFRRLLGLPCDGRKVIVRHPAASKKPKKLKIKSKSNNKTTTPDEPNTGLQQWSCDQISHWLAMLEFNKKQILAGQHRFKSNKPPKEVQSRREILETFKIDYCRQKSLTISSGDEAEEVFSSIKRFESRLRDDGGDGKQI